jgi:predicted aconitase with swiveling domain
VKRSFQGRAVLPGDVDGEALVSRVGFNAYASFYDSIHVQVDEARCADGSNPNLYGKTLTGKIICLPKTTGSTSAGAVWHRIARLGVAPKAMLFSQRIDSLAAGGLVVTDLWAGIRIVTVDELGDEFLAAVNDGDLIEVRKDGTVQLAPRIVERADQ